MLPKFFVVELAVRLVATIAPLWVRWSPTVRATAPPVMPAIARSSTSVSVTARVPLVTVTVSKSFLALASAMAPPVEVAVSVLAVSTPGSVIAAPEESVSVSPERGSVVAPVMAPAAVTLVVPPRAGAFSAEPVPTKVTAPVRAVSSIV